MVLACSVIDASPEWRAKERAWAYSLYPGLEELEERVVQAQQEARQRKQLREFHAKWGDIGRWVRARHFGSKLFLRRRLALLDADGASSSHVLVRSGHAGVLAVQQDPDWGAYCI